MDHAQDLPFAKGHGTGNDFVLIPDADGELVLTADVVAALCDRRRGLGGDGLLRVVRTRAEPEVAARAGEAEWFMDYRNADGSLAEMCGNGVRVYARYLVETGLAVAGRVPILTRSGVVVADVGGGDPAGGTIAEQGGQIIAVDMPMPQVRGDGTVRLSGVDLAGTVAYCGNPHVVCWVDDPDTLDLAGQVPVLDPVSLPDGANVELVARVGDSWVQSGADLRVRMRILERGVGETLSCGSGACVVAAVMLRDAGRAAGVVIVDVPGGRLRVALGPDRCVLSGPAVIVAVGTVRVPVSSGPGHRLTRT